MRPLAKLVVIFVRMKIIIVSVVVILALAYVGFAAMLYFSQHKLMYFPTEEYAHPFDQMSISNQGESIDVIVLNRGESSAVIYFGGNAEAVVGNAQEFSARFAGATVYLVNYRGYGGSSGVPSEVGIYADALKIYDEIAEGHSSISTIGRSLGSGVATYLAANRRIEKTVLITPYDSVLSVAKSQFPAFPVRLLLKDHYDSISRVEDIDSPVLVIAAEYDQVIPMEHTQRLVEQFAPHQVKLVVIGSEGHDSLSNNDVYYEALAEFI